MRESLDLKESDILDFGINVSVAVIRPKIMIDKGKADVWKMFDEMRERMKDKDPQKMERLMEDAGRKQESKEQPKRRGSMVDLVKKVQGWCDLF